MFIETCVHIDTIIGVYYDCEGFYAKYNVYDHGLHKVNVYMQLNYSRTPKKVVPPKSLPGVFTALVSI